MKVDRRGNVLNIPNQINLQMKKYVFQRKGRSVKKNGFLEKQIIKCNENGDCCCYWLFALDILIVMFERKQITAHRIRMVSVCNS